MKRLIAAFISALILGIPIVASAAPYSNIFGGNATLYTIDQLTATTSPYGTGYYAMTQQVYGRPFLFTGLTPGNLCIASNLLATTTGCSGGGSSVFPFDPVAGGNATTSRIYFYNGIYALGSTTVQFASTTAVSSSGAAYFNNVAIGTYAAAGQTAVPANGLIVSGKSGIGTTTPSQALSVQGNALLSGDLLAANLTATGTVLIGGGANGTFVRMTNALAPTFSSSANLGNTLLSVVNRAANGYGGGIHVYQSAQNSGAFFTSDGASKAAMSAGVINRMGITDSNAYAVESTGAVLALNAGTLHFFSGTGLTPGTDNILVDMFTITTTGKTGIGSTTPSQLLSVQGNALISGNITSVSNITATGTIAVSGTGTSTTNGIILANAGGSAGVGTSTPGNASMFGVQGSAFIKDTVYAANFYDTALGGTSCVSENAGLLGTSNCVSSLASAGGTLTVSSPTGNVDVSFNLAHANSWTGLQSFTNSTSTQATFTGPVYDSTNSPGSSGNVLTSNGANTAPTWQAAGGATTFFATTSAQNLATTTLSGLTGGGAYEISYYASTSPSGGFSYDNLRMCFNTCTLAAGNSYITNGNRITATNLVTTYEDTSSIGVNLINLPALLSTNAGGGDTFSARCSIDNNSSTVKNGQCTAVGHSNRVISDSSYTFSFTLKQATAAPITSVSFYFSGAQDGPGTFAAFATSTRITAKAF